MDKLEASKESGGNTVLRQLVKMITSRDGEAKGPSLDKMLEPLDKHLENFGTLVLPAPESKPRTPLDRKSVV